MVRDLFSAVPSSDETRTTAISNVLFVVGLALTAVIMPLDRVTNLATKPPYLSLIALLLLLQRGLVLVWDRDMAGKAFGPSPVSPRRSSTGGGRGSGHLDGLQR